MALLTPTQLDEVRQKASKATTVTYTKVEANAAAQAANTWIETNRGALPDIVAIRFLTAQQASDVAVAMGSKLIAAQEEAIFDAVGEYHQIIKPPPPDPLEAAIEAVRAEFVKLMDVAIALNAPGLTDDEKRTVIAKAIFSL